MQEMNRPNIESPGHGGGGPIHDDGRDLRLVTVSHGPFAEPVPVVEMTVGDIRARFEDRFGIDPGSDATLDGASVGDDVRVRAGQHLQFGNRNGSKGR